MSVEQRDPAVCAVSDNTESKGEMIKAPISLRDLRRRIYRKAKAEPAWRFWGLYVHVCKLETLREAYRLAKQNDGAPGVDGVTFEAIEAGGLEAWLQQLRAELHGHSYRPTRLRPSGDSQTRRQRRPGAIDSHYSGPCGSGRAQAHP
jgi:hypothetical protein